MIDRRDHTLADAGRDLLDYATDKINTPGTKSVAMTKAERETVLQKGQEFTKLIDGKWLLIAGELNNTDKSSSKRPEDRVRQSCLDVFHYPPDTSKPDTSKCEHIINVLLDSGGGSLDSAFKTVLYLSRYAEELNIYVPRRAKSASTLIALGGHCIYLSQFGELGPLDNQIRDPRDPATDVSALDCYQSVDYVRRFGFTTMTEGLRRLLGQAGGQIALPELLSTASQFALGAITPMLQGVRALDFGAWGRSLKIGEEYARILLRSRDREPNEADEIAYQLVYGYTHHPFPIDYEEALRIGLDVKLMDEAKYMGALEVVKACRGKSFIGFISDQEAKTESKAREDRQAEKDREAAEAEKAELDRQQGNVREDPSDDDAQPYVPAPSSSQPT